MEDKTTLPGDKDYITIGIRFGKKDNDLRSWVESIPKGKFSMIVKEAILAYINNDAVYRLPSGVPSKNPDGTIQKSIYVGKMDGEIYSYIYAIEPSLRSNEIKKILRYYLAEGESREAASQYVRMSHYIKQYEPEKHSHIKLVEPAAKEKNEGAKTKQDFYLKSLLKTSKAYNSAKRP